MPREPANKEPTKVINLKEFMLNNLRLTKQMPTLEQRNEKITDQSTYAPTMIVNQVPQAQHPLLLISNRMENGSSSATWRKKSSHWILKALS